MRGPRRGEERSMTRTTAGGGVSSPKRGRNGYADSNSNGSGNGFRRWREREAEGGGERWGARGALEKRKEAEKRGWRRRGSTLLNRHARGAEEGGRSAAGAVPCGGA
jgi:hypothetical protein